MANSWIPKRLILQLLKKFSKAKPPALAPRER
jgi:hypothetical protein